MNSRYKVIPLEQALKDLHEIAEGILEVSRSKRSAEKWIGKLIDRIDSLATMPERYPVFRYNKLYRSTNVGKYKIIYRVEKAKRLVIVLRIVYQRMNLARISLD